MAVPSYDKLIHPLLLVLSELDEAANLTLIRDRIAVRMNISAADRAERVPSGQQPTFDNRLGWAHDRLKRAGFSVSIRRGWWQITESGKQFAQEHRQGLSEDELRRLMDQDRVLRVSSSTSSSEPPTDPALQSLEEVPEQRVDRAVAELRRDLAQQILLRLQDVTPGRFEEIVLDVLKRMGYGVSDEDVQRTGRSGDGGIDGIINLDKLGLQKVYVQAKRWSTNVGAPEVQAFYGALATAHASMGVLITTSGFTPQARDTASRLKDRLVLVDGKQLAELMMDHGAGVSEVKRISIRRIDTDYFAEDDS